MKQLVAVLVAAMFAATSFAALAQDKGGKMDKTEKSSKMDKKSDKKKDKKKSEKKKSSDKMEKKS
jgi:Ni/Co efflux regulator RcnB